MCVCVFGHTILVSVAIPSKKATISDYGCVVCISNSLNKPRKENFDEKISDMLYYLQYIIKKRIGDYSDII